MMMTMIVVLVSITNNASRVVLCLSYVVLVLCLTESDDVTST